MGKRPDLEPSWLEAVGEEFEKPYMAELRAFLVEEMKNHRVYPPGKEMFSAFWKTPFHAVRVVVLATPRFERVEQRWSIWL